MFLLSTPKTIFNMKNGILSSLKFATVLAVGFLVSSCNMNPEVAPSAPLAKSQRSIVEVLGEGAEANARSTKPTFSTLNVALARTGLAGVVSSNQLTIFAPTDAAFAAAGLNPSNIAKVFSKEELTNILLYHAVGGKVFSNQLSEGLKVPTLQGQEITITLAGGPKVNNINIIAVDIEARNGVIHAIDGILMPE
jgi:uncharacterized surface protein with fasciclin (FAS1) repeats